MFLGCSLIIIGILITKGVTMKKAAFLLALLAGFAVSIFAEDFNGMAPGAWLYSYLSMTLDKEQAKKSSSKPFGWEYVDCEDFLTCDGDKQWGPCVNCEIQGGKNLRSICMINDDRHQLSEALVYVKISPVSGHSAHYFILRFRFLSHSRINNCWKFEKVEKYVRVRTRDDGRKESACAEDRAALGNIAHMTKIMEKNYRN